MPLAAELGGARRPLQGVRQVLRFNRHLYASAAVAMVLALATAGWSGNRGPFAYAAWAACALVAWWSVASVLASWWVYDRSELWRWTWIRDLVRSRPRRWLHVHAGLDESTPALRRVFPAEDAVVLDVYDPSAMTERSIGVARAAPAASAEHASAGALPLATASRDAAFLILSAHELRAAADRRALFAELVRVVRPDGEILLVEHLRDLANLAAYGPGALHFFSRATWIADARAAGLELARERRINAFVRALVFLRVA